jgi:hypothetical protein
VLLFSSSLSPLPSRPEGRGVRGNILIGYFKVEYISKFILLLLELELNIPPRVADAERIIEQDEK